MDTVTTRLRGTRLLNDIHSQLNPTRVRRVYRPDSRRALCSLVRAAGSVSICGGRYAAGGQQLGSGNRQIDMRGLNRVLSLDLERGIVDVQAGIDWPELIDRLAALQPGELQPWVIRQKQTGADRLTLGGALAANVHGRGLSLPPFVADIESFELIDADGQVRLCSRKSHQDLFRLAIGGYGLFGVVISIRVRLVRRQNVRRDVEWASVDGLQDAFEQRIYEGYLYGDFQFSIDPGSEDFLRQGIFACYRPVSGPVSEQSNQTLSPAQWNRLLLLAHTDKRRAFDLYREHYMQTDGQCYGSDTHQLSPYQDDYHLAIDTQLGQRCRSTEMITEISVPRDRLETFLASVRRDFLEHGTNLIYGTVRLVEPDHESFLAWARQPWACVIFNICTLHDVLGRREAAAAFRRLIDRGIEQGGTYYLTYHRWATKRQVLACYPQFEQFLQLKRIHDPEERFTSTWYRHYKEMFGEPAGTPR